MIWLYESLAASLPRVTIDMADPSELSIHPAPLFVLVLLAANTCNFISSSLGSSEVRGRDGCIVSLALQGHLAV